MADPAASSDRRASEPKAQSPWPWWVFFVLLLAWNCIAFWPYNHPQTEVPYSTFVDQLRAGNVTKVRVAGDTITGDFKKPYAPPNTGATSAPQTSAQAHSISLSRLESPGHLGGKTHTQLACLKSAWARVHA